MGRRVRLVDVDGPAEVGQLDDVVDQHDVFWLEVAMDHTMLVQVHEGFHCLGNVVAGLNLGEVPLLPELVEERAFPQFHHQEEAAAFPVVLVKLQTVLVAQERLDLHLPGQPLGQLGRHLRERYLFDCAHKACGKVLGLVDVAEATLS